MEIQNPHYYNITDIPLTPVYPETCRGTYPGLSLVYWREGTATFSASELKEMDSCAFRGRQSLLWVFGRAEGAQYPSPGALRWRKTQPHPNAHPFGKSGCLSDRWSHKYRWCENIKSVSKGLRSLPAGQQARWSFWDHNFGVFCRCSKVFWLWPAVSTRHAEPKRNCWCQFCCTNVLLEPEVSGGHAGLSHLLWLKYHSHPWLLSVAGWSLFWTPENTECEQGMCTHFLKGAKKY